MLLSYIYLCRYYILYWLLVWSLGTGRRLGRYGPLVRILHHPDADPAARQLGFTGARHDVHLLVLLLLHETVVLKVVGLWRVHPGEVGGRHVGRASDPFAADLLLDSDDGLLAVQKLLTRHEEKVCKDLCVVRQDSALLHLCRRCQLCSHRQ